MFCVSRCAVISWSLTVHSHGHSLALFLAVACSAAPLAGQEPGVPSRSGLVVTTEPFASDVGAAILRRGGNAVDAAIATAFALAVTHPAAGNLGGGGFMVIAPPHTDPLAIDYRERAPGRATPTMYLDSKGAIDRSLTATGYLAPGVPGTVRGLDLAYRRFGSLPWRELVLPAVKLAEEGVVLTDRFAQSLNRELADRMASYPASLRAYGRADGQPWTAGDTIRLPDLARTLRAIATGGPDAFYTGWIADSIANDMAIHGGLITREDLRTYQAHERVPIRGTYREYEIISMPPPSSGGVALVEMLNLVEPLHLAQGDRLNTETLHWLIETRRRAFLDRARYLGDQDYVDVPVHALTSKSHADSIRSAIDPTHAGDSEALGRDILTVRDTESDETTHFSILDRSGMAVSNTYTLEGGYGSHVVASGTGVILNNEMGDFNRKPGETNTGGDIGTPANLIAPGKRMLSSMTPTIVRREGEVVLITGSPGGRTIINTVFDIVLNVVEFGMSGREAVDAPRLHHQWLPDRAVIEADGVSEEVLEQLRAMGHNLVVRGRQGDAHSILVDRKSGIAYGINDRRSEGSKASVP